MTEHDFRSSKQRISFVNVVYPNRLLIIRQFNINTY